MNVSLPLGDFGSSHAWQTDLQPQLGFEDIFKMDVAAHPFDDTHGKRKGGLFFAETISKDITFLTLWNVYDSFILFCVNILNYGDNCLRRRKKTSWLRAYIENVA